MASYMHAPPNSYRYPPLARPEHWAIWLCCGSVLCCHNEEAANLEPRYQQNSPVACLSAGGDHRVLTSLLWSELERIRGRINHYAAQANGPNSRHMPIGRVTSRGSHN
ncbi:hypothetical protein VTO73DRAFT_4522 [Trametes versicolor]